MGVLVVGSVGYDTVWTPMASGKDLLGGSATFSSISASYMTQVSIVAVVGDDFLQNHVGLLQGHGVDTSGLEVSPGKTFRWTGRYGAEDVNSRDTLETQLNVLAEFNPTLTPEQRRQDCLLLANIDPELQLQVLEQMDRRPKLVAADTMNFWIEGKRDALAKVIEAVDIIFMDEDEVRLYAQEPNLVKAARIIHDHGVKAVIAKRGEHGVLLFNQDMAFAAPAFPLDRVVDPTGAGDSFAGGFMGYLAETGDTTPEGFRRAAIMGSVMGSFAVESLSVERLGGLAYQDMKGRFDAFVGLTTFNGLGPGESLPWRNKDGKL